MTRRSVPVSLGSQQSESLEVGGVLVTSARFPPGLALPPHVHDRPCVAATLGGAWESVMVGRSHACKPATVMTEPPGERHSNHFSGGANIVVIQPDPGREPLWKVCAPLVDRINHFSDPAILLLARRIALEMAERDDVSSLAIEGLTFELLSIAARRTQPVVRPLRQPRWLDATRELVHRRFRDPLRIGDIAAEFDIHPVHLARMFRARFGISIGEYVRALRLDWACEELTRCDRPIADIAIEAGFSDQSHFTRTFRRHTGSTPGRYRRRS